MTMARLETAASDLGRKSPDAFIRRMAGFGFLSESDKVAMASLSAPTRRAEARSDLVRQGDVPDGALILLEGFACRYRYFADGRRQILAFLLPGDVCDLDAALIGRMDHAIATLTTCTIARVPSEVLANLLEEHPRVASALRKAKLGDEATSREWLVSLGCRHGPERLAHLFCELLVRLQAVELATSDGCDLPITQAELGDAIGLSTVHVNRSLQALRAAGLIQLASRKLRVVNLPGLRSFCDFSPPREHSTPPMTLKTESFGAMHS